MNFKKSNIIFIIPARGGSRRLKGKNLKNFNGKPLIFWTIEQALRLSKYGKVVVSSESEEILNKCLEYKRILLVKRHKYLSTAKANLIDVAKDVSLKLGHKNIVVLLQPTSPLRSDSDIIKGIKLLQKGSSAVMSQSESQYDLSKLNINFSGKKYKAITKNSKKVYAPNGAFFGATYEWIKNKRTFYSNTVTTFAMPPERSIDIDFEYQFIAAEAIFKIINVQLKK